MELKKEQMRRLMAASEALSILDTAGRKDELLESVIQLADYIDTGAIPGEITETTETEAGAATGKEKSLGGTGTDRSWDFVESLRKPAPGPHRFFLGAL